VHVILSDAQYLEYVVAALKLPKGKRSEYLAQVDTLIERLTKAAKDVPELTIRKFLKTGSMRKGTVLKPKYPYAPDADVAVFIELADEEGVLDRLHSLLKQMLVKAYPTKSPDDFTIQPRTLGIEFLDSGLSVDLVPVIPIDGPGDYGMQPSSQGKAMVKTSVAGQLEFIRSYKEVYANWTAVVRLLKRWRQTQELEELRSFTIELIVCCLQATQGTPKSIDEALSRVFLFLAQSLGTTRVSFSVTQGGQGDAVVGSDSVVVVDPVNPSNNVSNRITANELVHIRSTAEAAWELHHESGTFRTKGETIANLRNIFGKDFTFES
jgi:hypothetical protein